MSKRNVLIMGAAGRDFHNFNVFFRNRTDVNVVAFTATQIPDIDDRKYPKELAGSLYPKVIPTHAEEDLVDLMLDEKIDELLDLPHTRFAVGADALNSPHLHVIGPAKIAKRIVCRNEHPSLLGHCGKLLTGISVEREQPLAIL